MRSQFFSDEDTISGSTKVIIMEKRNDMIFSSGLGKYYSNLLIKTSRGT
jgi:hypothetical protein